MKNKEYKIKVTKKLIKQLKPYWEMLKNSEDDFYRSIREIEMKMERETGIKGIQFHMCDNEHVGIGNLDRSMRLIFGHGELEE